MKTFPYCESFFSHQEISSAHARLDSHTICFTSALQAAGTLAALNIYGTLERSEKLNAQIV